MRHTCISALGTLLAAALVGPKGECDEPRGRSSAIVVEGRRISFDPRTCTEGKGEFSWGNGSVRITLLGREDRMCVFDYQWEVEGAGNYLVHRVRVPTDSGPVVIEAEGRKGDREHHWSAVFTSFTETQATLIRRASFGWCEDLVEGTGEFVAYHAARRGEPEKPAVSGERVVLRFTVYDGDDFEAPAGGAKQGQVVTLAVGRGEDWKWARVASAGMARGELRRVRLPAKIAGEAKGWLPGVKGDATLFLEMEMTAVERN